MLGLIHLLLTFFFASLLFATEWISNKDVSCGVMLFWKSCVNRLRNQKLSELLGLQRNVRGSCQFCHGPGRLVLKPFPDHYSYPANPLEKAAHQEVGCFVFTAVILGFHCTRMMSLYFNLPICLQYWRSCHLVQYLSPLHYYMLLTYFESYNWQEKLLQVSGPLITCPFTPVLRGRRNLCNIWRLLQSWKWCFQEKLQKKRRLCTLEMTQNCNLGHCNMKDREMKDILELFF